MSTQPSDVYVRVLGPISVWCNGEPVELGGAKTKALIARLLIDRNDLVPVDSLLQSLWPDSDQVRSEVTLRSLVSRLRRRLREAGVPDGFIVTRSTGYVLAIEADRIDAQRFEGLLVQGRASLDAADPARSADVLDEALGLWRGPALGDIGPEPFAQVEARRLEELRLSAIEMRLAARLQLGQHHALLDELASLTETHWTREQLWCLRMLALHRSSRSADALVVFEALRSRLISELGVEPGSAAVRLEEQIRRHDPALDSARPATEPGRTDHQIPLPASCTRVPSTRFVGRTGERAQLDALLDSLGQTEPLRMVFIGGEPGIGKTTLATEVARQAHRRGDIVLWAGADEEFCAPYQPWVEALTHLVEHAPPHLLAGSTPYAGPLVQMVPRLQRALGPAEMPASMDPEAARYVWFDAVLGMLRAAAALAPVVLILDDLQWADLPSLQLLRHVMSSDVAAPLLVIGIYRQFGAGTIHPLAQLLGETRRSPLVERIELHGIDDVELQQMMEHAAGRELEPDDLLLRDALLDETDGNPFFLGELLQHLIDTGLIGHGDGGWYASAAFRRDGLPASVREVIGQRVARLGDLARRTLMVASVIGRDFEFELLAALSELSEEELLDVLDAAMEGALVLNTGPSRYSFVHALVEHTVYDMVAPTRRARFHRQVAEAIEVLTFDRVDKRVIELAHHWAQTNDPDSVGQAIRYAQAAGDEALHHLAPDAALHWYAQVRALLAQAPSGDDTMQCQVLIGVGQAQRQTGDAGYRETLLDAARMAQRLGATDLLVDAVLANSRGFASSVALVDSERVTLLEVACAAVEGTDSAEQARLLSLLALELTWGGDFQHRKALADRALAIARADGDPATLCAVVNNVRQAIEAPETLDQRLLITAEAFDAALTIGDEVLLCVGALNRTFTLYQAGEAAAGDEVFAVAREISERLGQPAYRWWVTIHESDRAILLGDLDEAERLARRALDLGLATGQPDAPLFYGSHIGVLRTMQGRADEIVELVRRMVAENAAQPAFTLFLAMMYCDLDRPDEARDLLEPFVADGFASLPHDLFWLPSLYVASYAVAALGWPEAAGPLLEQLRPFATQVPYLGPARWCQVSYVLALLCAVLGRDGEADSFFDQAAESHSRIGATWCLALTQLSQGEFAATRSDAARASALLGDALVTAEAHGYRHIVRRATRALQALATV